MATVTKRLQVEQANEMLVDCRNAIFPFTKDVFIFAHRYNVTTDYPAGDNLVIEIDGAQEILYSNLKEVLAATNTNLNAVEGDISTRLGKNLTTAVTNASSLAVEFFAIVRV